MVMTTAKTASTGRKRQVILVSVIVVVGLLAGATQYYWLPWARYLAYRSGLTVSMTVDDVSLSMQDGWYIIGYSKGGLGKYLMNTDQSLLVLGRVVWPRLGQQNLMAIKKIESSEAELYRVPGRSIKEVREFPWGKASIVLGERDAVISDYSIRVSVLDSAPPNALFDALSEIRAISTNK